jgi:uncharacterized protein (TIGR02147 family)
VVKKLGFKATTSLTMIINGQRHPGQDTINTFIQYFKFDEKQSEYFADLVRFEKLKTDPRLYDLILKELKRRSLKNRHKAIELKKIQCHFKLVLLRH